MKKIFFIASSFFFLSICNVAKAKVTVQILSCASDDAGPIGGPIGGPSYQVIKKTISTRRGKKQSYSLKVKPLNPTAKAMVFKVKPVGSGDEDYDEYTVVDPKDKTDIQNVSIQENFEWANLSNEEQDRTYSCN